MIFAFFKAATIFSKALASFPISSFERTWMVWSSSPSLTSRAVWVRCLSGFTIFLASMKPTTSTKITAAPMSVKMVLMVLSCLSLMDSSVSMTALSTSSESATTAKLKPVDVIGWYPTKKLEFPRFMTSTSLSP